MAVKSDHEMKHAALVARCNQLLELIKQENNRLKQAWDDEAKQSILDVLEALENNYKASNRGFRRCLPSTPLA